VLLRGLESGRRTSASLEIGEHVTGVGRRRSLEKAHWSCCGWRTTCFGVRTAGGGGSGRVDVVGPLAPGVIELCWAGLGLYMGTSDEIKGKWPKNMIGRLKARHTPQKKARHTCYVIDGPLGLLEASVGIRFSVWFLSC
jgi:hypothetical protein